MNLNLLNPILDPFGVPVMDGNVTMTIRTVIVGALYNQLKGDDNLSASEKADMHKLGVRIAMADSVSLSVEDRKLLKDRIGRAYHTLVVGRAFEMLDPEAATLSLVTGGATA